MRALTLMLLLAACEDGRDHARAVCALIDTSGTYLDQVAQTSTVLRRAVLPHLRPGDSLVVVRIGSDSYHKENVETAVTLDERPSQANLQKTALAQTLSDLPSKLTRAKYTDIRGGMILAAALIEGATFFALIVCIIALFA